MRLRTLSTLLSDVLSHLPGAEYERAKCEGLAAQVQEQRAHIEDLARRLEHTTRQKDEAEEAHVDAYEIRLDKTEGERDAIKAQYEAEKGKHGDTRRHLTAAIAERDEWQLSHGTVAREKEQLKVELHTLRARVAELQAGEPVRHAVYVQGKIVGVFASWARANQVAEGAWTDYTIEPLFRSQPAPSVVGGEPVAWLFECEGQGGDKARFCTIHEGNARSYLGIGNTVTPLYAAPKPAAPAYGVEGERFGCLASNEVLKRCFMVELGAYREFGARDEAASRVATWEGRECTTAALVRIIPADAPVVDVAKIREALKTLRGIRIWTAGDLQVGADAFVAIARAIGEEA